MPTPVAPTAPPRPAFRDGQVLRADELANESASRISTARRHQQFAHLPGIVAGLWMQPKQPDVWLVEVSPGLALDAAGRSIFVSSRHEEPVPEFVEWPFEVWIAHRERETRPDRIAEQFELLFEKPGRY